MTANGVHGGFGLNVEITLLVGGVPTLTTVANVLDGSELPEIEKYLVDMTPHTASSGDKVWVDSGKKSLNSFKMVLGWDPEDTTHIAIVSEFGSPTPLEFAVISPGAEETLKFNALVGKIGRVTKQEGGYQCDVTIQPVGGLITP